MLRDGERRPLVRRREEDCWREFCGDCPNIQVESERERLPGLKRTTEAMHHGLGSAVFELRDKLGWGQEDLAEMIRKQGRRVGLTIAPSQITISRWENGERAPAPAYRMALARIADSHKATKDLADIFRAGVSTWRVVGHVKLGLADNGPRQSVRNFPPEGDRKENG